MKELLNADQLNQLVKGLEENGSYELHQGGLNIQASKTDNSISLTINYKDQRETEIQEFTEFLQSLDDNLFLEVCENLDVNELNNCLNNPDIESVRSAIFKFKNELSKVAKAKAKYYAQFA